MGMKILHEAGWRGDLADPLLKARLHRASRASAGQPYWAVSLKHTSMQRDCQSLSLFALSDIKASVLVIKLYCVSRAHR